MKKLLVGLLALGSISAFATDSAVRLDNTTIKKVFTEVESKDNGESAHYRSEAQHTVSVETVDGKNIKIKTSKHDSYFGDCDEARKIASNRNAQILILVNSIKLGTLKVIEKQENVVCATQYLDVAIDSALSTLGLKTGLTPIKCP
jgi:hypothetical protein